jgi:hypothetical protein
MNSFRASVDWESELDPFIPDIFSRFVDTDNNVSRLDTFFDDNLVAAVFVFEDGNIEGAIMPDYPSNSLYFDKSFEDIDSAKSQLEKEMPDALEQYEYEQKQEFGDGNHASVSNKSNGDKMKRSAASKRAIASEGWIEDGPGLYYKEYSDGYYSFVGNASGNGFGYTVSDANDNIIKNQDGFASLDEAKNASDDWVAQNILASLDRTTSTATAKQSKEVKAFITTGLDEWKHKRDGSWLMKIQDGSGYAIYVDKESPSSNDYYFAVSAQNGNVGIHEETGFSTAEEAKEAGYNWFSFA